MMTRKERVRAAVAHRETDIVPYSISLTREEHDKVAAFLHDKDFAREIGNHITSFSYEGNAVETSPGSGIWKDDFGVLWDRTGVDKDIGMIQNYQLRSADIETYTFPALDKALIRAGYDALMRDDRDIFRFGSLGFSLFERAWTLRGMENLLADMVISESFVERLLDKIFEYNMELLDIALEYDIDGFHFGDDWGQQHGLIMGPAYWRKYIKPRLAGLYAKVKSKGLIISQHSCGDIYEIFPDLIEIGLDIYQTFQPEIYDIRKVKREYGADLTFWGGISTQRLLPFADRKELFDTVFKIMDIMSSGGGYIAAPTHSVPADVPAENIVTLIEIFKNQKKR